MRSIAILIILMSVSLGPRVARSGTPETADWALRVWVMGTPTPGRYILRLTYHPASLVVKVSRQDIGLSLLDAVGRAAGRDRVVVSPEVPATVTLAPVAFTDVPVVLDARGLLPAPYRLRVLITAEATEGATTATLAPPEVERWIGLPPQVLPPRTLTPGQRFLVVLEGDAGIPNPFRVPPHDQEAPWRDLALRVLTLERIERQPGVKPRLWFAMEGRRSQVTVEWDEAASIPYLRPIVEDNDLSLLRRRFEGHRVWAFGGFHVQCATPNLRERVFIHRTSPTTSFRVLRIVRILEPGFEIRIRGGRATSDYETTFLVSHPLTVILGDPEDLKVTAWGAGGVNAVLPAGQPWRQCFIYYSLLGGSWQTSRVLTTDDPGRFLSAWPAAMREAVLAGSLRRGMSRDMVTWSYGWPDMFEELARLRSMDSWRYDWSPPQTFWVYFRQGRVVRFGQNVPPP